MARHRVVVDGLERVERLEIDDDEDVRAVEVDVSACLCADAAADLTVEFALERLADVGFEVGILAQEAFVLLGQRRDARPDLVGRKVDALESIDDGVGDGVVGVTVAITDPTLRGWRGVEVGVVLECNRRS